MPLPKELNWPLTPPPQKKKITIFFGGVTLFLRGFNFELGNFYSGGTVEDILGQAGSGSRQVGQLHLSGRRYWAMNFNFFLILDIFRVFLYLDCGIIQRMPPKWTFCLQFLRITPENFFGNLIDLLLSPKTFISNIMTSKMFFRILKAEQKEKKWKDSVSSIHFGHQNF